MQHLLQYAMCERPIARDAYRHKTGQSETHATIADAADIIIAFSQFALLRNRNKYDNDEQRRIDMNAIFHCFQAVHLIE